MPAITGAGEETLPAGKPNVVFVLVDDLDVQVYQSGLDAGLFPNLRALMSAGTTFTNSYVSMSLCCPSRATLLTGQYGHNHGTVRNKGDSGGFKSFKDASTLAVWMKAGGYRTAMMGKYLNGYSVDQLDYVPPGWDTWNALLKPTMYDYAMTVPGGYSRYGSAPEDYQTDVYANLADAFIRVPGSQPFYLALNPSAPHLEGDVDEMDDGGVGIQPAPRHAGTPVVPLPARSLPSFNELDMSDKPAWLAETPLVDVLKQERVFNEKRTAMRAVDDMVGRLARTLVEIGKWNNTLFIFASDNGFQYGSHRRSLVKVDPYEESIQVPLVIKSPGQRNARRTGTWALNNDWAVTVMDYAGLQPGAGHVFDGRSLRPFVLEPRAAGGRQTMLVELPPIGKDGPHPPFVAVRSKDPALTLDTVGGRTLVYIETLNAAGTAAIQYELYDLFTDPYQLNSLHRSLAPNRVRQRELLQQRLEALKSCVGTACKALED
ncbi:MAG TPA: sulfatase [Ideonella sp.]|nr:sulfatase [Ideonella sp.]